MPGTSNPSTAPSTYYVPLGTNKEVVDALPLSGSYFHPLPHVPLYSSPEDACMAWVLAYSRHAKRAGSDEPQSWMSAAANSLEEQSAFHKDLQVLTVLQVSLPPEAVLALPVHGKTLRKGGSTCAPTGPFHHFGGQCLTAAALKYVTSTGEEASFVAHISVMVLGFGFDILTTQSVRAVQAASEAKSLQAPHSVYDHHAIDLLESCLCMSLFPRAVDKKGPACLGFLGHMFSAASMQPRIERESSRHASQNREPFWKTWRESSPG